MMVDTKRLRRIGNAVAFSMLHSSGDAIMAAADEIDRLREALGSIRQFGADTLSGRVDGPDDRAWQREAVREMTKRARAALNQQEHL